MKKTIRIASGQGFWGDLPSAPVRQLREGPIDYLVMDYLAEVTMSILQKQRMRDADFGYARDFVEVIREGIGEIRKNGVKVISNAGGVNPHSCKDAVMKVLRDAGAYELKVAVVDGDDILPELNQLIAAGHTLNNMETGEPITSVQEKLLSANVYFGCRPVVEALAMGADIIITGRVTDTGLTLAPMIHEFGWSYDQYDLMAAGTIAGHMIECGGQVSGGNFTDWECVENLEEIGFPIIEASADGTFCVTKHEGTGGLISEMTVKEQLLYEIGNPAEYITPDCIADFTSVKVEEQGKDRVKVSGIKGYPETSTYKISASYLDGYKLTSSLVYCWPDALKKARKAGEILTARAQKLGLEFKRTRVEYVGLNACSEDPYAIDRERGDLNEVEMRISVHGETREEINRFGREIAPLILTGPSGVTGFAGGRPKASDVVAYWPALLEKEAVEPGIFLYDHDSDDIRF